MRSTPGWWQRLRYHAPIERDPVTGENGPSEERVVRTLIVSGEYPWPVNSGSRLRLASVVAGLRQAGPVDLLAMVPSVRTEFDPPDPALGLGRCHYVQFPADPPTGGSLLRAVLRPGVPIDLHFDAHERMAEEFVRFATDEYDLVWYFGVRPWFFTRSVALEVPSILDVVDLEDQKIAARLSVPRAQPVGLLGHARRRIADQWSAEEIRRWRRIHRLADQENETFVTCSSLDADRARLNGVRHLDVIPNGYPLPDHPAGRRDVAQPPTLLFAGTLRYPPNAEAAEYLVRSIGPEVRRRIPDVSIRVVGTPTPAADALHDPPRVVVTGHVPDIVEELARADIVATPVRFGSGTRLKVVEAFAHRIPVISTTLGAEGLGAVDGTHLLLADDAETFARAVERLLADDALRHRLVDDAHRLYLESLSDEVVRGQVAELAQRVAERARRPGRRR